MPASEVVARYRPCLDRTPSNSRHAGPLPRPPTPTDRQAALFWWLLSPGLHRFRSLGPLQRPPFFRGGDDPCHTFFAETAFWLRCFGWRSRLRLAPDLGPPCFLRHRHLSPGGSTESLALPGGRFRRGGSSGGATRQHPSEFGYLSVNPALLRLEPFDGGGDDFVSEFCWHVIRSTSILLS